MLSSYERQYKELVDRILTFGEVRNTRNAVTKSMFGCHLDVYVGENFPLLQGRRLFYKNVLGELAALLRKPTCVEDFERWGCNYWALWSDSERKLKLDYGNTWFDFNGVDQIAQLKDKLKNNPTDRRMLITGWKPDGMEELSLPCCHLLYQFYVHENGVLDMIWYQRSVDVMVGLPSDVILAAAWLIAIAHEFDFKPGRVVLSLGDCHIYEEHFDGAELYLEQANDIPSDTLPTYSYTTDTKDFCEFKPEYLVIKDYEYQPRIKFKLEK